jgi:hypothetical protein
MVAKAKKEFEKKQKEDDQTDNGADASELSMIFMMGYAGCTST